jgi:hypothetical protein
VSDTIAVDFDGLRQHAARVEQIAGDVEQAVAAARSLNLAGGAFGVMCGFLVPPAMVATEVATGMIQQAAGLLERAGAELRGTAEDGEATERSHLEVIRSLAVSVGN